MIKSKMIISRSLIEFLSYHELPFKPRKKFTPEEIKERQEMKKKFNTGVAEPEAEKTISSVRRAKAQVKRIVFTNFYAYKDKNGFLIPPKFLTITFKENIQDLKSANYQLTKFIQWLNYRFKSNLAEPLQYVCVPEFQERGAVHYHIVLFNFPFMHYVFTKLRAYWEDQFELKTIGKGRDAFYVVSYMTKYITKQAPDGRFWGQKRYFVSRNIKKSTILNNSEVIEIIRHVAEDFLKDIRILSVPYLGDIRYEVYYLGNNRTINSFNNWFDYLDPQINKLIALENL